MSNNNQAGALLGIHALTALHPGAGTALGTVDLPVQRERHTQWPTIAGSALKGILRDACRNQISQREQLDDLPRFDDTIEKQAERKGTKREKADATIELNQLFGPPTAGSSEFAGAVSVSDARLLAFPVRSMKGVFAWITCPAVMERFARDSQLAGIEQQQIPVTKVEKPLTAVIPAGCPCKIETPDKKKHLLLEEFKLEVVVEQQLTWANEVAKILLPLGNHYQSTRDRFGKQLVIVHDDDFTHFVKYATEVNARIALDYETKTVKSGALFYQEFLPTETLFYSLLIVNAARSKGKEKSATNLKTALKNHMEAIPNGVLQIGGDETTGKGFCSVRLSINGGAA